VQKISNGRNDERANSCVLRPGSLLGERADPGTADQVETFSKIVTR